MKKHIYISISVFIILIFLCSIAGKWIVFKSHQFIIRTSIKREIQKGLSNDELTCISVQSHDKDQIEWVEDHEFRFNGEMYDVVKVEYVHDITKYWCVKDNDETALYQSIEKETQLALLNDPTHQKQSKNISSFFNSLFFQSIQSIHIPNISVLSKITLVYSTNYCSVWLQRHETPPELFHFTQHSL